MKESLHKAAISDMKKKEDEELSHRLKDLKLQSAREE